MKLSILLPLAATANAAFFNLLAVRSASPIHYARINVNENGLWIGKEASAYCPPEVNITCPAQNQSTVFAQNPVKANGTLNLGVIVPGGQQIYVDPSNGALGYTIPHSAAMPPYAIQTGWTFQNTSAGFSTLDWTHGLLFCSKSSNESETGPWQMFAQVSGVNFGRECLGAALIADTGRGSIEPLAWQY